MSTQHGARVLIVGAGGLGSPVALSLADSPAVATLTIVDPDRVELSNLHRQLLLRDGDLGRLKVLAAADTLALRRSRVQKGQLVLQPIAARLAPENADTLLAAHDLLIEGSDDLTTKFLLNDWAVAQGVPAIIGGVVRFVGQVQTIWPGAACYRCLFEAPPQDGAAASCQQAGVLGPACGVVAGLLAGEALRALSFAPSYAGAVLTLDLLRWQVRRVPLGRRRACAACALATRSGEILDSAQARP